MSLLPPRPRAEPAGGIQADSQKLSPCRTCGMAPGGSSPRSGGRGCVSFPERGSRGLLAERLGEAGPPTPPSSVAVGFQPLVLSPPPSPRADDNSNQSSIADASPIKQENSSNSSPAPEPNSAVPGEGTDAKADEAQADGKELPGTEGTCPQGHGPPCGWLTGVWEALPHAEGHSKRSP